MLPSCSAVYFLFLPTLKLYGIFPVCKNVAEALGWDVHFNIVDCPCSKTSPSSKNVYKKYKVEIMTKIFLRTLLHTCKSYIVSCNAAVGRYVRNEYNCLFSGINHIWPVHAPVRASPQEDAPSAHYLHLQGPTHKASQGVYESSSSSQINNHHYIKHDFAIVDNLAYCLQYINPLLKVVCILIECIFNTTHRMYL